MPKETPTPAAERPRGQTVLWIIAVLLGMIASALWTRDSQSGFLPSAMAQTQARAGARGVFAFTGQLDRDRYGLFMLDVDEGTVWCYEIRSEGGGRKMRLVAARTWIYDRFLRDFNCTAPSFRMVQELVAQQRAEVGAELDEAAGLGDSVPAVPSDDSP